MTIKEIVELVVAEINSKSKHVTASVGKGGRLVLTARAAGTKTGLHASKIADGDLAIADGMFSGGDGGEHLVLIGNEGDTFFQRWDGVKTLPRGDGDTNKVVEAASVMLETHINLDGRTDIDRGSQKLASLNWSGFGALNHVYSQSDNYLAGIDYDESLNLDSYPASLTWTLQKSANAEIDEWTHITLASTLALDGDKGSLNALRRFQNNIVAFQDRGISEVLFNSRTQIGTTEGVPVEIANSGKVDGKRYITGKYGVTNKWSIVEGKSALYFVDNVNKALCSYNGVVENISEKLGFGVWFRNCNSLKPWTPESFDNIVSFYDRIHSDVYFVKADSDEEAPCLVYSETLGAFTSFYDYGSVSMLANVGDKFVSYKENCMWLQNEGFYCNFFGKNYGYHTTYRVVPDPFTDKIWTNVEYRADEYTVLDDDGASIIPESRLLDGGEFYGEDGIYSKDGTFDTIKVWNEYQQTDDIAKTAVKKFRIWRLAIPRAAVTETNKFGLDRIRNPWINLKLGKTNDDAELKKELMQLHDITVKYFE